MLSFEFEVPDVVHDDDDGDNDGSGAHVFGAPALSAAMAAGSAAVANISHLVRCVPHALHCAVNDCSKPSVHRE